MNGQLSLILTFNDPTYYVTGMELRGCLREQCVIYVLLLVTFIIVNE